MHALQLYRINYKTTFFVLNKLLMFVKLPQSFSDQQWSKNEKTFNTAVSQRYLLTGSSYF